MPTYPNSSIAVVRKRLLDGMMSYMDAADDCGYVQTDVNRCASIIDNCMAVLSSESDLTEHEIRDAVKRAVLELNALNANCGHRLIETDQREYICELLLVSAQNAGLGTEEDITEEWRQW